MATVSSISTSNAYGYGASAIGASQSASQKSAQVAAQAAVESTLTSLGGNSSSPLTYNAAGLVSAFQQAKSAYATTPTTSAQQAQAAVLAAETAVTETLASLLTAGSSKDSSNPSGSDISPLFSLPGTSQAKDPFGMLQSTPKTGASGAQTTQESFFAVENVITNTLGSLGANSSVSGK